MNEFDNFDAKKAKEIAIEKAKEEYYEVLSEIKNKAENGARSMDYYSAFKNHNTADLLIVAGFNVEQVEDKNTDLNYYYKITW